MRYSILTTVLALIVTAPVSADDWPQYLGPTRSGVYTGKPIADRWPADGPRTVWRASVGAGFAGPVVAQGKLYIFHRLGDRNVLDCLDAKSGKEVWRFAYPAVYRDDFGFDNGPRAVPAVADGLVYTHGAEGVLHCVDAQTGELVWRVDTAATYGAGKGFFGRACSPMVEGDLLMLNLGGRGAGIAAFDRKTGKLAWKATDHEASYASPTAVTMHDRRIGFFYTRTGLVALDPVTGRVLDQTRWRPAMNASVNATTPIVAGDLVFVSTSYNTGGLLVRVSPQGKFEQVWAKDGVMSNHYATCVYHDGHLYGYHGRQERGPSVRCVELKTGQVKWSQDDMPAGTVTLAHGKLLILTEDGELIMTSASPKGFAPTGEAQILGRVTRAYPAIADGHFYARDSKRLVCVDLTGP